MITRGIRNNNPFNIVRSNNSWKGKITHSKDERFEQFTRMEYGVRAGILLLRNGYLAKGFDTVETIISKYAPSSENNVARYCHFIVKDCPLDFETKISVNSFSFYWLCQKICKYESDFDLSYDYFINICKKFSIL